MAVVRLEMQDHLIQRFGNQLAAVGEGKARIAMVRAVNRVTTTVHGRVIKAIRKQSDIPTAIIKRQVKRQLANLRAGAIEGHIIARGNPVSLKYFKARQFSFGVKAKWGGAWHNYAHAFMGPSPGVIARRLGGNVFVRESASRMPIEMLFGPSVPEELVKGMSEDIFHRTVVTMLPDRVRHELGRMLTGA